MVEIPSLFMAQCLINQAQEKLSVYFSFVQYKYLGICSGTTINTYERASQFIE
jgi:hypothetical protein